MTFTKDNISCKIGGFETKTYSDLVGKRGARVVDRQSENGCKRQTVRIGTHNFEFSMVA